MLCSNCGFKNKDTNQFCTNCGKKLNTTPKMNNSNYVNSKHSYNKLIIAFLIVILLIVSAFAGFVFLNSNNNSNNSEGNTDNADNIVIDPSTGFPVSQLDDLAVEINNNGYSFDTVRFKGVTLSKQQCLYILSKGLVMLNTNGESGYVPIKDVRSASYPRGNLNTVTVTQTTYIDIASRTSNWFDNYGRSPNYTGVYVPGSPDLSPDKTLELLVNIFVYYSNYGVLPQTITA